MTRFHASQCDWHCDQYERECNCGVSQPATVAWAQSEVSGARLAVGRANECLAVAEARLREMEAATPPQVSGEDR